MIQTSGYGILDSYNILEPLDDLQPAGLGFPTSNTDHGPQPRRKHMTSIDTTRYASAPQPDSSDCPDYEFRWSVTFGDSADDMGDDEMPFVHHDSAEAFAKAWIAGDEAGIDTAVRLDTR